MNASDLLEAGADLLLEHGWCKGELARDEHGQEVRPLDPRACQWCAEGAIRKVAKRDGMFRDESAGDADASALAFYSLTRYVRRLQPSGKYGYPITIADWNDADDRSVEEVANAMRACAADLRAGGDS